MNFDQIAEFSKDCKRLQKKYKSLGDDLKNFQQIICVIPLGNSKHFNVIRQTDIMCIIKARLFCRYLKGSSLRIVYSYNKHTKLITFIEVFFKGGKETEDTKRIASYLEMYK